jgi:hypothetical protein
LSKVRISTVTVPATYFPPTPPVDSLRRSLRFDVYGNNFGWGKITVFFGAEEGSIDFKVCLSYEILEALRNDRVHGSFLGHIVM